MLFSISGKDVSHQLAKLLRISIILRCRLFHFNRIVAKVGHIQSYQQFATICMWIGSHSTVTLRRECGQFWHETTLLVKQLFWFVAAHPILEYFQVVGICLHFCNGYLM